MPKMTAGASMVCILHDSELEAHLSTLDIKVQQVLTRNVNSITISAQREARKSAEIVIWKFKKYDCNLAYLQAFVSKTCSLKKIFLDSKANVLIQDTQFKAECILVEHRPFLAKSLHQKIRGMDKVTPAEKLWLIYQILTAVQTIHHEGWYHGDLSTKSIFLSETDKVIVSDFALVETAKTKATFDGSETSFIEMQMKKDLRDVGRIIAFMISGHSVISDPAEFVESEPTEHLHGIASPTSIMLEIFHMIDDSTRPGCSKKHSKVLQDMYENQFKYCITFWHRMTLVVPKFMSDFVHPYVSRLQYVSRLDVAECLRLLDDSRAEINVIVPVEYRIIFLKLIIKLWRSLALKEPAARDFLKHFFHDFSEFGEGLLFELVRLFSIGDENTSTAALNIIKGCVLKFSASARQFITRQLFNYWSRRNSGVFEKILLFKLLSSLEHDQSSLGIVQEIGIKELKHGIFVLDSTRCLNLMALRKRHELRLFALVSFQQCPLSTLDFILECPTSSTLDIVMTNAVHLNAADLGDRSQYAKLSYLKHCAAMHPLPSVRRSVPNGCNSCSKDYYELRLSIEENKLATSAWEGVEIYNFVPCASKGDSTICDFLTPVLKSDAHFERGSFRFSNNRASQSGDMRIVCL